MLRVYFWVDEVRWALTDHLGTVRDWVDSAGVRLDHIAYDSFGRRISSTDNLDAAFGFTGALLDEDTGLQNHWNRWYDTETGSWVSQDPIGFAAGDANLYRYVENSTTDSIDPDGLKSFFTSIRSHLQTLNKFVDDLFKNRKNLDPKVYSLGLDLAQFALDIVGIIEPTPAADGINTAISLCRRDWWGAGFSALGMIPYVGDVAKVGKIGKYVQSVTEAIDLAKKSAKVMKLFKPAFESVSEILKQVERIDTRRLPNCLADQVNAVKAQVAGVRKQLDDVVSPVKPGDTGTYGDLKSRKRRAGETEPMDMDHQPSFASQRKAAEDRLGRQLSADELKALKDSTPAVASPRKLHQETSPTYGGRNTPERIAEDAADPGAAALRDRSTFDDAMRNR